tara:strand:+ start:16935 stop:17510 length:576 start_codon:yes stop_codon:yes gene_type:complete
MNFIETYKIDPALCDKIIGLYELNKHLAQPGRLGGNPRVDKSMKDSMDLSVPVSLYGSFAPFFELLQEHVSAYLEKYYYSTGAVGMGPVGYSRYSSLQKYAPGGGYPALHCERDGLLNANRALVWMLYLTDTPGGGTEFPHQGIVTECVKGDLLLWPPDMTHMHRGVVSQTHEKMIFTGWIDFIEPPAPKA